MGIVVCDNGTGFVKVGWATSNAPDHTFPSIVGKPMLRSDTVANLSTAGTLPKASGPTAAKLLRGEWLVGQEAEQFRDHLDIHHPMENGVIREWEEMEAIWRHAFALLGVDSGKGHDILLTEPPMNPKQNRERMVRLMLDKFGFERVHVAVQATLVLYSQGLTTGVVVDSGDGVTHMVPVFEGVCPQHLVRRIDLAGRDVTRQLIKLLQLSGYQFNRTSDFEQVRLMKESVCYIAYRLSIANQW